MIPNCWPGVLFMLLMACSIAGCSSRTSSWDSKVPIAAKPSGLIRIIPITPLVGASYPAGTLVSKADQKLTLTPFPGDQTAWFAIELSGWGSTGLKGYSAQIIRGTTLCPRMPCGCRTSENAISCDPAVPGDCAEGSRCVSGICTNAFIDENASDFVFFGKPFLPSITESDPDYTFHIGLKEGAMTDPGAPVIGGYLAIGATDGCPDGPSSELMFNTSAPPFFVLGDGSIVYPAYSGAYIFFEP